MRRRVAVAALAAARLIGGGRASEDLRYECATATCERYAVWDYNHTDATSSERCVAAQGVAMAGFGATGLQTCRDSMSQLYPEPWADCRQQYCQMFDDLVNSVTSEYEAEYRDMIGQYEVQQDGEVIGRWLGGDECQPLRSFNRSLCETKYRDAEAFCGCFCPVANELEEAEICDAQIMAWLLFGRRGGQLGERYKLTQYCAAAMCSFFEKIADPDPVDPIPGVPGMCKKLDLPYRPGHCAALVTTFPYVPEPWKEPLAKNDTIACSDGSEHVVYTSNIDTLDVCLLRDDRMQCAANFPVMCSTRKCVTSTDYCCVPDASDCSSGEERQCTPILCSSLPEWSGFMTPADYAVAMSPSTTTTVLPAPTAGDSMTEKWAFTIVLLVVIGGAGCAFAVATCFFLGHGHWRKVTRVLVGTQRLTAIIKQEPLHRFAPTFSDKWKRPHLALKPLRPQHEIEAERADRAAAEALRSALRAAEDVAMRMVASAEGMSGPTALEEQLQEAIDLVRERPMKKGAEMVELLSRGDRFLRAREAERKLGAASERARSQIDMIGNSAPTNKLDPGVADSNWYAIEGLRGALEEAEEGATDGAQRARAAATLSELVAKAPELPHGRCVPDPRGGGLLLLPPGHRTTFDQRTGDMCVEVVGEDREAWKAVDVPGRERLVDVAVDEARPVCAQFAREGQCKIGRRCPWRHCKPKAGDAIKESFAWDDD